MNDAFTPSAFATTAAFLAVATAVTVMAVALVSWRLREPRTHRGLWRIALATILLLFVGEATGLFWACGAWLRYATAPRDIAPAAIPTYVAPPPNVPEFDDVSVEGLASEIPDSDAPSADAGIADATAPTYDSELDDRHALAETSEIDLILGLEWNHELEDAETPIAESVVELPGPIETPEVADAPALERAVDPIPWQRWCGLAWGSIASLLALRLIAVRAWWLWRYRRATPVTDSAIKHSVGVLARELRLRRRVAIWSSPRWVAPVAWGVWRPSIGLPVDFRETFTPAEQDAMLAHELGHLAARDPLWQCLADGVTAVLWWAPWCWWVRRQLRVAAEWMADEASLLVADGPRALAECLVVLGRRMAPEPLAAHAVTGNFRSNLGRRVERLLELAETAGVEGRGVRPNRWRMPALAMCAVLSMAAGSAWARSSVESTQGVDHMRWFEQSWRRSLAGGIVSLALGAPTSAVMAQDEGDNEVAVEVEVTTEESADENEEDDADDGDGEEAEEREDADDDEEDADEKDDADEDDDKKEQAAVKQKVKAEKSVEKAMQAKEQALSTMKEKLNKGLNDRVQTIRIMEERLRDSESRMAKRMAEAAEQAQQKVKEAQERGDKNAPELEGKLREKLSVFKETFAKEQRQSHEQLEEAHRALQDAQREAEAHMIQQQDEGKRALMKQLRNDDQQRSALKEFLRGQPNDKKRQAIERHMRVDEEIDHAKAQAIRNEQATALIKTIHELRRTGHHEAASQVAEVLKSFGEQSAKEMAAKAEQSGWRKQPAELDQRVDRLQGEVSALRGEIAELRDLLKQALSEQDAPPRP